MMTFEEYKEKTYKIFLNCSKGIEKSKLDSFFNKEEQQNLIRDSYKHKSESYKKGHTKAFDDDAGYVLALMYE